MAVFGTTLLVTGSEELLVDRAVASQRAAALDEAPEAEVNQLPASQLADTMLSEITGGSLFASHTIAILTEIGAAPVEEHDQLVSLAADPGPELCLILVHDGSVKGKKLLDRLKKAKVATSVQQPIKPWELPKFAVAEAKRLGVGLSGEAANALIAAVGTNLSTIASAIAQLAEDAEANQIDAQLVGEYFAGQVGVSSYAIADAALGADPNRAMERLRWARQAGESPVAITAAMAGSFRGLAKYLEARNTSLPDAEIARRAGIPPWKLRDYAKIARFWHPAGLAQAIQQIASADAAVKGAASDADFALEAMLLAVLKLRRG